ncbi:MAG: hypothetical protein ACLPXB_00455 [Thiobacillaceae bacterium]
MDDDLWVLAGQLLAVPGAPDTLLRDYFSGVVSDSQIDAGDDHAVERWRLVDASMLALFDRPHGLELELSRVDLRTAALIVPLPACVLTASSQNGDHPTGPFHVSPLLLALIALAAGYLDGDRPLRRHAPQLFKRAQQLLLSATCRLCG